MRAFIALYLEPDLSLYLSTLISKLQSAHPAIRWTRQDHLHITISFYQEIDESEFELLYRNIAKRMISFAPFDFSLHSIDIYPGLRHPRILWVRLTNEETFSKLHQHGGFVNEHESFIPHITLGRFTSARHVRELSRAIQSLSLDKRTYRLTTVDFIKSTLTPAGPHYDTLYSIHLQASAGNPDADA